MDSSERLVHTWMASGRDEEIKELVSGMPPTSQSTHDALNDIDTDISNDRTSLIKVVKALGEYLTSEDSDLLQKGV